MRPWEVADKPLARHGEEAVSDNPEGPGLRALVSGSLRRLRSHAMTMKGIVNTLLEGLFACRSRQRLRPAGSARNRF